MQQTNLICYTVNTIYKLCSKKKTFNPQWIRKVSARSECKSQGEIFILVDNLLLRNHCVCNNKSFTQSHRIIFVSNSKISDEHQNAFTRSPGA